MKKEITIILGLFILVLLSNNASAFGEGDIVTQGQLDLVNATTINLQCQLEDLDHGYPYWYIIGGKWYWMRKVSCLSIIPYEDGDYIITREGHNPYFRVLDYILCRLSHNKLYCDSYFRSFLQERHSESVLHIRDIIKGYQTVPEDIPDYDFDDEFEV